MNKKRNILVISHEATLGGATRSLLELLEYIKEYINIVVILPHNGIVEEYLAELNINYYIVPFSLAFGKIGMHTLEEEDSNYINNYRASEDILAIVKKERIELIYTNSSVGNVGAITALRGKIPHIWHIREFLEEHFSSEFWDKELKKSLFSITDQFITISECIREKYRNIYNIDSECIYDAVDYKRYYSKVTDKRITDNLPVNILIAGWISREKGQYDAIRAVEILVSKGVNNIKLLIVGNGVRAYRWELEQYIWERRLNRYITIMPFQQNLKSIRDKCSISLTCSKMEALGRVTIEAMMAGLVVIGANTGGTVELIGKKEERGYFYREGDVYDLADKIHKVLDEQNECLMKKRISAQEYAKEAFDSHVYASKIYNLIEYNIIEYQITNQIITVGNKLEKRFNILYEKGMGIKSNRVNNFDMIYMNQFFIMNKWFEVKYMGGDLGRYLEFEKLYRIAIYGMGFLGSNLFYELSDSNIMIVCVFDKTFCGMEIPSRYIKLEKPNEIVDSIDAIIITMAINANEIKNQLKRKFSCKVLTIEELINLCITLRTLDGD